MPRERASPEDRHDLVVQQRHDVLQNGVVVAAVVVQPRNEQLPRLVGQRQRRRNVPNRLPTSQDRGDVCVSAHDKRLIAPRGSGWDVP